MRRTAHLALYELLGLAHGADVDELRVAYRRLAKALHPDIAGPDGAARFLEVKAAYETLLPLLSPSAASPRPRRSAPRQPRPSPRAAGPVEPPKASLGTTTYDEAVTSDDPAWDGAAWYGPTLGEYWQINPREYADPRKHGPEYEQRARRALRRTRP